MNIHICLCVVSVLGVVNKLNMNINLIDMDVYISPIEECVIHNVGITPFIRIILRQFGTWGNWVWLSEFGVIPFRDLYNMHIYDEAWKLI